jgi:hypothetical protein
MGIKMFPLNYANTTGSGLIGALVNGIFYGAAFVRIKPVRLQGLWLTFGHSGRGFSIRSTPCALRPALRQGYNRLDDVSLLCARLRRLLSA